MFSIVVGGQFGSEGKGKVAYALSKLQDARFAVRVGGANSGHTAISNESGKLVLRHLPTPILNGSNVVAVIPAGAYINVEVLLTEIRLLNLTPGRLLIHPEAVIVTELLVQEELSHGLINRIGSTGQGIGAAVASRVLRNPQLLFARDISALREYVHGNVPETLASALSRGERILLEGTQGFGLSLLHGGSYPYCTSRDTTAAGVLSETGLSPLDVDSIILVIRAFPIRVAGNSGPLPKETTWDEITRMSGSNLEICERTTVTQKVRRVARFDPDIVLRAVEANHPTHVCLNHADYWDSSVYESERIGRVVADKIYQIERKIGCRVNFVGTGPSSLIARPNNGWRKSEAA